MLAIKFEIVKTFTLILCVIFACLMFFVGTAALAQYPIAAAIALMAAGGFVLLFCKAEKWTF